MRKQMVERFYSVLWNSNDKAAIPSMLAKDFTFRGSLGHEKRGHKGFSEYVDMVHSGLAEYQCIIDELVAEGDKVFAKMTFTGIHNGHFLDFAPTGKRVRWAGCALFTFDGDVISDVWVLGDLKSLESQLRK